MSELRLRRIPPDELERQPPTDPVDDEARDSARAILDDVREHGQNAVLEHAHRLGDLDDGAAWLLSRRSCEEARDALSDELSSLLERTADRIRRFAEAQRAALAPVRAEVPGGFAGHWIAPVECAGAYAPGGRYPLLSSLLMTVVTARAAGVPTVVAASPRPSPSMLAAAAIAGADQVLALGGPPAIAAMAYGVGPVPRCDAIVGPGNRYVTAAKELLAGRVRIESLAGPTELVVVLDDRADLAKVAADLLAQGEHDVDARPVAVLVGGEGVAARIDALESELARQLETLPTAKTARAALERHGAVVLARDEDEAAHACDLLAPEHLQVLLPDPRRFASALRHFGGVFLGEASAEVLGDYGAGPNHVLPTGGAARITGGLSVLDFLRVRTWLELEPGAGADELARDAAALARLEGLEGHARAAERRARG